MPQGTHANVLSSLIGIFSASANEATSADAAVNSQNLQTLNILQADTNPNPTPTKKEADLSVVADSALENSSGPSGAAAEVADVKTTDQISVYTVHPGDTLSQIAQMFGVSQSTVLLANNLKSASDIHSGEQLVILPVSGIQYTVKKGDTIASIAAKYKVNVDDIVGANDISVNSSLSAGDILIVPDADTTPASTPTSSGSKGKPSSGSTSSSVKGYFARPTNGIKTQGLHGKYRTAVDLASPVGTAVHAAASGKVIVARMGGWNGGYGNYIVIQHSNGMQSLYAHLSEVDVTPGAYVSQGDFIGKTGNTGNSTGPHLHFEILGAGVRNWNPFN